MTESEDPRHFRREGGGRAGCQGFSEDSEAPWSNQMDFDRTHTAPAPQGLVVRGDFLKAVVKLGAEQDSEATLQWHVYVCAQGHLHAGLQYRNVCSRIHAPFPDSLKKGSSSWYPFP